MLDSERLTRVLDGRERWYETKRPVMAATPEGTWVELSLNIAGWPKRTGWSARVHETGLVALTQALNAPPAVALDNDAGHFALLASPLDARAAKAAAIHLEGIHPLGRLWDVDVYEGLTKLSREALGARERACLLCPRPHSECVAPRRHRWEDLRAATEAIALGWLDVEAALLPSPSHSQS